METKALRARGAPQVTRNLPEPEVLLRLYEQMVLLRRFETRRADRLPQGRDARLPASLYRRGGDRASASARICGRPTGSPRPIAATAMRWPRACDPRVADGRALRQARRLLRRPRRHHAPLRPRRSACSAPTASSAPASATRSASASARATAGHATTSRVAFFGDGATNHGGLPRGAELRRRAAGAGGLRLREQPLRHRDAARDRSTLNPEIATRAAAYGIPGVAVDGNDVVAVWTGDARGGRAGARAATGRR